MRPPERRYSIDQIIQAGRWAWAASRGDDEPDLYYDGADFWSGRKGRARSPVAEKDVPREGWWHENGCHCELCRPSPRRNG
jgi:hypothetical protein